MPRRRETIIALRARHEAFRVANEVANPHLDVPPPPTPPWRPDVFEEVEYQTPFHEYYYYEELGPPEDGFRLFGFSVSDIVIVVLFAMFAVAVVCLALYG